MKTLFIASGAFLLVGLCALLYALLLPVYTDDDAPSRLSNKLQDVPRDQRFKAWHSELREFETYHKVISDTARGLISLGLTLALAAGALRIYTQKPQIRQIWVLLLFWVGLWVIKVPFTFWYYDIRAQRFDYPSWGDSIAIPIFSSIITWGIGCVLTTAMLLLLLYGRRPPSSLEWRQPSSIWNWIRALGIGCWILILGFIVLSSIPDGDEGMIISSGLAIPVLWLTLLAKKKMVEQAGAVNSHAFGTFVTDPAGAGSAPKASGDT